jgi:hypothetical protein
VSSATWREFLSGQSFYLEALRSKGVEEAVWRALDDTGRWHQRQCRLTAPLVLWTVVSMSLFRPLSIANAFVKVLESARGAKEGPPLRGMVTEEAIYHARARLGYEPLEHLAKSMAPTASTDTFLGLKARRQTSSASVARLVNGGQRPFLSSRAWPC